MSVLSIQLQPDLVTNLDLGEVSDLFAMSAEMADAELTINEGDGEDLFINYDFIALHPARLWQILQNQVLGDPALGWEIACATIVTCQGEEDDQPKLLLHHYDRSLSVDTFPVGY